MSRNGGLTSSRKISVLLLMLAVAGIASARVIYVDSDASGANNGTSWENAYVYLQDALTFSGAGDEIRVAQGIYRPDDFVLTRRPNMGRAETFELANGMALIGGYAGLGTPDPNARDVVLYETILSGDLAENDAAAKDPCDLRNDPTRDENSYHVVVAKVGQFQSVVDGFTITAGNANGENYELRQGSGGGIQIIWNWDDFYDQGPLLANCTLVENCAGYGGGVYVDEPALCTITNCKFIDNSAEWGGGMGNGGYPTLMYCTFKNNHANWRGGAIANGETRAIFEDCTFLDNRAEYGGVMYNGESGATLTNCTLIGNSAEIRGGAVYNNDSSVKMTNCIATRNWCNEEGGVVCLRSDDGATLTNCILTANSAKKGGVLYAGEDSYAKLTNCTVTGNRASEHGGALYIGDADDAILANCILRGNTPHEILEFPGSPLIITYSNVQGIVPGGGNIDADPCFASAGHWELNGTPADANDDVWIEGDYHLKSQAGRWDSNSQEWAIDDITSPCIDAGDPMTAIMHEPFPSGGIINMGAYAGTAKASKSYFGKPPCETIVAGDINGDCTIDFEDFRLMALHWCEDNNP